MPHIEVDIDLTDIETNDLVEELCIRFKLPEYSKRVLTDNTKKDLKEILTPLYHLLQNNGSGYLEVKTMEDKMKYEHIVNVWSKYSSSQLESLIP